MAVMKKTSIYLDEELDQALAAKAAEEGVTKAEFIRRNLEVVVSRPKRPRISVGSVSTRAEYVYPEPRDDDAELAKSYERRDHERRERSR